MTGVKAGGEEGFVLIATVWFVALLALAGAIIAGWMYKGLGRATSLNERLMARAETISAESEIAFLMVTGYYSPRGLELGDPSGLAGQFMPNTLAYAVSAGTPFIALDDRPYRLGQTVVRLQDARGLFNLNLATRPALAAMLRGYDIAPDERDALYDKLRDYMAKSEFRRLHGATDDDYAAAGQPLPRDAPLLTPWEAYRILGWKDDDALWREPDALPDVATIVTIAGLNPNTAPLPVLRTIPGVDDDAAQRILNYRSRYLIADESDLAAASGVAISLVIAQYVFFPAPALILTVSPDRDPVDAVVSLSLTPLGSAPYRIDYAVARPRAGPAGAPAEIPPLPGFSPSPSVALSSFTPPP